MFRKSLLLLGSALLMAAPLARAAFNRQSVIDEPVLSNPVQYQEVPQMKVQTKPAAGDDIWSELDRFKRSEFREWADDMALGQLLALDRFAKLWGAAVTVSGNAAALGRHMGPNELSQHNIDRWGEVRAVDVFPEGLTRENAKIARDLAKQSGFSGIGVYLDTSRPMMHLDTRPDRTPDNPAQWSRIEGEYLGIERAFA
ncbi:hypothetical protein [uncultured Amphritea sp.]|uniref:hypothetical protein n=1 Tax=uncultured Amphritea sp. TaxID=981605 RepID=UPI00261E5996|nr:hypothetical protein [uncultured Amphritea sp.]